MNQTEKSIKVLQNSIEICDEIGFLAAGAFRGSLAMIYSQQNEYDKAIQLIKQGEPVIAPIPFEYAKFLCKKAKVYQLNHQENEAKQALQHAEKIAQELGIKDDSELKELIINTRNLLTLSNLLEFSDSPISLSGPSANIT